MDTRTIRRIVVDSTNSKNHFPFLEQGGGDSAPGTFPRDVSPVTPAANRVRRIFAPDVPHRTTVADSIAKSFPTVPASARNVSRRARHRCTVTLTRNVDLPFISLGRCRVSGRIVDVIPSSLYQHGRLLPLSVIGKHVTMTVTGPGGFTTMSSISTAANVPIVTVITVPSRMHSYVGQFLHTGTRLARLSRRVTTATGGRISLRRSSDRSTSPITHFMDLLVGRTVSSRYSSVRVRPRRSNLLMHCHVSNILRVFRGTPHTVARNIVDHVGIVTRVSVNRHHGPRSNHVAMHRGNRGISLHITTLPAI